MPFLQCNIPMVLATPQRKSANHISFGTEGGIYGVGRVSLTELRNSEKKRQSKDEELKMQEILLDSQERNLKSAKKK